MRGEFQMRGEFWMRGNCRWMDGKVVDGRRMVDAWLEVDAGMSADGWADARELPMVGTVKW